MRRTWSRLGGIKCHPCATSDRCADATTDQTARLDQALHLSRRGALDQPHRTELDQPHPTPPASHPDRSPQQSSPPADDDGDDDPWLADPSSPLYTDPAGLELRDTDTDTESADDVDILGEQLQHTDTRWSLELDNPYLWLR